MNRQAAQTAKESEDTIKLETRVICPRSSACQLNCQLISQPNCHLIEVRLARSEATASASKVITASNESLFVQLKEKTMRAFQAAFVAAMFAIASFASPASWAQGHADHIMVAPKDLKWADVPSLPPGAKIAVIQGPMNEAKPFTVRLKFPANYKIPAHSHPGIEHVTIISGTFNMGTGDKLDPKQTKALSAGSVAIMQPKTNHFAWTKTETIVQLHGMGPWGVTYVNPADDPRKK